MYQLGDVLRVQCIGFKHYGIYAGDDKVVHNSKQNRKVAVASLKQFSQGNEITVSSIKSVNPSLAVPKAMKYINLPYKLFSQNCEHFVRTACGLVKESTQIQKYMISAVGVVGALWKSDNAVLKAAAGGVAVGSLLTPTERSPIKNAIICGCLGAVISWLVTRGESPSQAR